MDKSPKMYYAIYRKKLMTKDEGGIKYECEGVIKMFNNSVHMWHGFNFRTNEY